MLDQSAAATAVLLGTWTPRVRVDAWYDGEVVAQDVTAISASTSDDSTQAIQGSGQVTAAAEDDSLIPTSWDSPLACYGSVLHVQQGVPLSADQVEWYSMGWFPIVDFSCADWWREVTRTNADGTHQTLWAPLGTQVTNTLDDRWQLIDQATFAAPEQPAQLASAVTEIERLIDGIVDMGDWSGVSDAAIPATVTYSNSRTDAIQQLAGLLGVTARMDRDGALGYCPVIPGGAPVWKVTVAGDDQVAQILAYARKGDRTGLYNQFISTGTSQGGTPVQGVVTTATGPLRFGGPLGRLPYQNDSSLLTTDTACQTDAQANQARYGGAQTVQIPVTVPTNPALETCDVIELDLPGNLTLTGPVVSISRADLWGASMDVVVKVSRQALWGAKA